MTDETEQIPETDPRPVLVSADITTSEGGVFHISYERPKPDSKTKDAVEFDLVSLGAELLAGSADVEASIELAPERLDKKIAARLCVGGVDLYNANRSAVDTSIIEHVNLPAEWAQVLVAAVQGVGQARVSPDAYAAMDDALGASLDQAPDVSDPAQFLLDALHRKGYRVERLPERTGLGVQGIHPTKVYPCEIGAPIHMNVETAKTIYTLLEELAFLVGTKELGTTASYRERVASGRAARSTLDNIMIWVATVMRSELATVVSEALAKPIDWERVWADASADDKSLMWANANDEERAAITAATGFTVVTLPGVDSVWLLVGPNGGDRQPCTVVAATDQTVELSTEAGERFALPLAKFIAETS